MIKWEAEVVPQIAMFKDYVVIVQQWEHLKSRHFGKNRIKK